MTQLDILFTMSMVEIFMDSDKKSNVAKRKFQALQSICGRARKFLSDGIMERIVMGFAQKKVDFLLKATTIAEVTEIEKPSLPSRRSDGRLGPGSKYHVEEEELLMWQATSLRAPLISCAYDRYVELFKKLLPEHADAL